MKAVLSRIWTQVADSNFYDDNCYAWHTSINSYEQNNQRNIAKYVFTQPLHQEQDGTQG